MTATPARPPLLVLVDDDIDHAVIARTVLASVAPDLPVEVLTDPREVQARLRAVERGALVLIDRMLGRQESIPLIGPLVEERPDLRVALLSSSLSDADASRATAAGAMCAIEKPGSIDGWRRVFRALIEGVVPAEAKGRGEKKDSSVA